MPRCERQESYSTVGSLGPGDSLFSYQDDHVPRVRDFTPEVLEMDRDDYFEDMPSSKPPNYGFPGPEFSLNSSQYLRQSAVQDDRPSTSAAQPEQDDSMVVTYNPFPAHILIPNNHDVQPVTAAECDGERCYVSQQLVAAYNITPENGRAQITWRKSNGGAFNRTLCDVLVGRPIGAVADLVIGTRYGSQPWSDHEIIHWITELTISRLQSSFINQHQFESMAGSKAESRSDKNLAKPEGSIGRPEDTKLYPSNKVTTRVIEESSSSRIRTQLAEEKFPCDWEKCPRARDSFHNRDHQYDHYRSYHHEDLTSPWGGEDQDWWDSRWVSFCWWRCSCCLIRVKFDECCYTCPECNTDCHPARQRYREELRGLARLSLDSSDAVPDSEDSSVSSSDESFDSPRSFIERRKEEIIGKAVLATTQWLRSQLVRAHVAAHGTASGPCEGGSISSGTSGQSLQEQGQLTRKRKSDDRDDLEGDDDDDDDRFRRPYSGVSNDKGKEKAILRFACPYFKYNPWKYQQWPTCPGPGWLEIGRVKEHLYRRHKQAEFRCGRCWVSFHKEEEYFDHQRALVPCELKEKQWKEGFDKAQEKRLRSRKKSSSAVSDIDKWKAVYRILFPHVPEDMIPSPFYGYEQPAQLSANPYVTLTECEEYVLREMPMRLREILSREFDKDISTVEQNITQHAIKHTRDIIGTLFQEFRTRHQQGTTPIPAAFEPGGSQDHAGPSQPSRETQPPWFDFTETQPPWPDFMEIDNNFIEFAASLNADGSISLFHDTEHEGAPEAPLGPTNCSLKESDSGYDSNNPASYNKPS